MASSQLPPEECGGWQPLPEKANTRESSVVQSCTSHAMASRMLACRGGLAVVVGTGKD